MFLLQKYLKFRFLNGKIFQKRWNFVCMLFFRKNRLLKRGPASAAMPRLVTAVLSLPCIRSVPACSCPVPACSRSVALLPVP